VVVVGVAVEQETTAQATIQQLLAAPAALALSSLKYLTTYPQHSLVALHLACPHPVGSTSTL
jgi:hypothetical protein